MNGCVSVLCAFKLLVVRSGVWVVVGRWYLNPRTHLLLCVWVVVGRWYVA